jgi:DNA primase
MGRIPEHMVREILDKTDILSIVGEYTRLTKRGGRWLGLCPFHSEKSPSFNVDPEKGLFYCFGCQKGGSVVQFLMELEKESFPEVMEGLAKRVGISLTTEELPSGAEAERKSLYELYDRIATTFHWFLTENPGGASALHVLHARGIPDTTIREFRLGYSPMDRRWLHGFLVGKGYSENFLSRSGFFSARTDRDALFAGRLMFPIADIKGRVVAFGGRILEGEGPKYLNSPDTQLFHKQDTLFGIDKALAAIKKEGKALICEGYLDALSFHVAGIQIAVAPLGTAFTSSQARLIKRWADEVLLCFDADEPGQKAAERACAVAAEAGLAPAVLELRGGKDASEILEKEGAGRLQKNENFTINGDEFLIRRARSLFDIGTVGGKAKAAAYLYPYADALDSETKRSAFLDHVARELGANPVSIISDYETTRRNSAARATRELARTSLSTEPQRTVWIAGTPELLLLAAVVLYPSHFASFRKSVAADELDDPRARDLYLALEESYRGDVLDVDSILARAEDEFARQYVRERAAAGELAVNPERLIADGVLALQRRSLERRGERILARMAGADTGAGGDGDSLKDLLFQKMNLDAELESMKGERDERP